MKNYLAVFLGLPAEMDAWKAMPEAERKEKEQMGMRQWMQWATDHEADIVYMGGPLGKTKKVNKEGVSDIRNEMGAFTVVQAESHEAAAQMFVGHPHYTIFPGDRIEVMECLPVPKM